MRTCPAKSYVKRMVECRFFVGSAICRLQQMPIYCFYALGRWETLSAFGLEGLWTQLDE
jgi:hypothetical protein